MDLPPTGQFHQNLANRAQLGQLTTNEQPRADPRTHIPNDRQRTETGPSCLFLKELDSGFIVDEYANCTPHVRRRDSE